MGCGKYCSNKCKRKGQTLICKTCGKSFYRKAGPIRLAKHGNFCSNKCVKKPWNGWLGRKHKPSSIDSIRTARLKQKFSRISGIELIMKAEFDKRGVEYIHQYPIAGRFVLDFAFPEIKLGVECDGTYWHSLPTNKEYGIRKDEWCKNNGWTLLRFTEDEINNNPSACVDKVISCVA